MAYKIDLLKGALIHPVFHVSNLKLFQEDEHINLATLSAHFAEGHPTVKPEKVLQIRNIL